MILHVTPITTEEERTFAMSIRKEVFVIEQKVPEEEEYDEFEETARHFIAWLENKPVGTARWRFTEKGAKLERFAVLSAARGRGVGSALVKNVLKDIAAECEKTDKKDIALYLHSQVTALDLYQKFGFKRQGDQFDECGIMHYYMSLPLAQVNLHI